MAMRPFTKLLPSLIFILAMNFVWPARLLAHCDGLDGPVVKAAQAALCGT